MERAFDSTVPAAEAGPRETAAFGALEWCWPLDSARAVPILSGVTRMGRGAMCDVVVNDQEVSRSHAEVRSRAGGFSISDLGSRNGTYVNGSRIESTRLAPGDVCRIGGSIAVHTIRTTAEPECQFGVVAEGLLGGNQLAAAIAPARRAAPTLLSVVIEGETGTGKEQMARAIHSWSGRSGPLVPVNCGAIPEGLAEAELFGYRKGAFTGASQANSGYFRAADGGTLFLDEVAELPLAVQAKLLRAIEQLEVMPLGENRPVKVDVRILASTHAPLAASVIEGTFRADLYARLSGLTVRLPPLRERREDVPHLFAHFLRDCGSNSSVDPRLIERLLTHDFALNVRELKQLAHRLAVLHGDEPWLTMRSLEPDVGSPPNPTARPTLRQARRELELPTLRAALKEHGGKVAAAAKQMGISRQRAYRLLNAATKGVDVDS